MCPTIHHPTGTPITREFFPLHRRVRQFTGTPHRIRSMLQQVLYHHRHRGKLSGRALFPRPRRRWHPYHIHPCPLLLLLLLLPLPPHYRLPHCAVSPSRPPTLPWLRMMTFGCPSSRP
jgi:hypothetical protein